jgi:hypothetical protein
MEELKMGDLIQVWNDDDQKKENLKRKLVKFLKNGAVCCVSVSGEADFDNNDSSFGTYLWKHWQRIPEEKYIHFAWEDRELLKGKWIKHKKDEKEFLICGIYKNGIEITASCHIQKWEMLLKEYEFTDGSPCGKKTDVCPPLMNVIDSGTKTETFDFD